MKAAASALLGRGQERAREGKLDEAVDTLGAAKTLDPSLALDPGVESRRLRAVALVAQGERLAKRGQVEEAVRAFGEAKTLGLSRTLDPETEARQLAAGALAEAQVAKGKKLAGEGKVQEALTAYAEAGKLDPTAISAEALTTLCWDGTVAGHPEAVMESCEAAVLQEPQNGAKRDSRGLARALAGNQQGAIEDFKFFIEWARIAEWAKKDQRFDPDELKRFVQDRMQWIADLEAGKNPFNAAVLKELQNE
jgi:tetratricopeptide (TPR) repeat protein